MIRSTSINMQCIGLYRSGHGYVHPEQQISAIETTTLKNNLDLIGVKDLARGQFKKTELLSEFVASQVDCVIVWRLDCLSPFFKNLEDIVSFLSDLSRRNIAFISVHDGIDTEDLSTEFLVKLNAAWLELKTNRRIENGRKSAIKAKLNGNKPGPVKRRDDNKIFELHQEGLSIRKIAKKMNVSPGLIHQALKKRLQENIVSEKRLQPKV